MPRTNATETKHVCGECKHYVLAHGPPESEDAEDGEDWPLGGAYLCELAPVDQGLEIRMRGFQTPACRWFDSWRAATEAL